MKKVFILILLVLISVSCGVKQRDPYFKKINKTSYPKFHDEMDYEGLVHSMERSLDYYGKFKKDREFYFGKRRIKKSDLEKSILKFKSFIAKGVNEKEIDEYIKENFEIYTPCKNKKESPMLFTGYYEPELKGSLEKTQRYKYPLYIIPESMLYVDLGKFLPEFKGKKLIARKNGKKVVPFFTNEEIVFNDALKDQEKLVWLDDMVDLFFLQIQGSGKIYLEKGGVLRVHFAGGNGHKYRSIGKFLIDKKRMTREEMSMQNLKKYLKENPDELREILSYNESYVFFEKVEGGPYGALGQELTPGRSLASDLKIYPRGAIVYVKTKQPLVSGEDEIKEWVDMDRFMVVQDTGGAIKGYFRGDIFFGSGDYARIAAGHFAQKGDVYILIPKGSFKEK